MSPTISIEDRNEANEHLDRAISFGMCGKVDQAIAAIEKALELDENFPQAYNKLGDFYMKKGWIQQAADAFAKSIELDPANENSHFDLGCACTHLGEYDRALASLKAALEIKPKHFEVYGHIGQIYLETNRTDEAIGALQKARKGDKLNLMATFNLGIALHQTGRGEEAVRMFTAVIDRYKQLVGIKDKYAEGNYYIGRSLYYLGKTPEAITFLKLAVQYDTEEVDYHYSFGMLYSDADAFFALAEAQNANSETSLARENVKNALEIEPDNQNYLNLQQQIGA